MAGKLYVIGVGPGDPELLTLKAVRILKDIPFICVPKGREEGKSLALSIVKRALTLDNKEIMEIHFPMRKTRSQNTEHRAQNTDKELDIKWDEAAEMILNVLNKGEDGAFLTMGDPTIYSTFFYLYDRILEMSPSLGIEIIPGVSSINAAASRAKTFLGLADEKIAILPATYVDNLGDTIEKFDTVVLMKVHKVFDRVLKALDEMNLSEKAVYISKAGMDDEKIIRNIRHIKEEDLNYFSILIIKHG